MTSEKLLHLSVKRHLRNTGKSLLGNRREVSNLQIVINPATQYHAAFVNHGVKVYLLTMKDGHDT